MFTETYILIFSYSDVHCQLCLHPISLFYQGQISSTSVLPLDCAATTITTLNNNGVTVYNIKLRLQ